MIKSTPLFRFLLWLSLVAVSLACALSGGGGRDAQATAEALAAQSTALALQMTQQAQHMQSTLAAQVEKGAQTPTRASNLEELRQNARILLYEDILTSKTNLERYVKRSLDEGGYSYFDTEGDPERLKENILYGATAWDLIIVSAEASGHIPAEYFEFLVAHLQRETALILEMWDMDDILQGRIEAVPKLKWILDTCGVEFHTDWYNPSSRQVFLLRPEHPLLNQPHHIGQLESAGLVWRGDIGDLMKIKRVQNQIVGDATFLVGLTPANPNLNGLVTTCVEGRVVIQTFASHEYGREEMIKLWQNYIYHTLNSHFLATIP
ncbi:MAG: hypothetical protein NZ840_03975 [Anaerolineales bacterium]|nr:hypothetical protein [Anaerolineales bacterium]MDW8161193.1 hypothetical protein [Anaerolineales bacterium]